MTYHKFERGLGKKDIQIAPNRCYTCNIAETLYSIKIKDKKVYVCKEHRK